MFKGARGGRLALWRDGEMELEVADLNTGQMIPRHFTAQEGFVDAVDALLAWISAVH